MLLSTFFLLFGIITLHWLHNQYQLDIIEERNIRRCVETYSTQPAQK
jgi:hypothetical protein